VSNTIPVVPCPGMATKINWVTDLHDHPSPVHSRRSYCSDMLSNNDLTGLQEIGVGRATEQFSIRCHCQDMGHTELYSTLAEHPLVQVTVTNNYQQHLLISDYLQIPVLHVNTAPDNCRYACC